MRTLARTLWIMVALVILLVTWGWLGLQVDSGSFTPVFTSAVPHKNPLSPNLPAPVLRFAQVLFSDGVPDVRSAMVLGQARLAPTGLPMPTRFRFYYDAARSAHYHDIQVTWFTLPFMRIHERNLDGHATLDMGIIGRVDDMPQTNRSAVQGYWGEVLAWVPSIALTDPRVRWEAIDATTARLYLPGLDDVEAFTVHFDADTGLMTEFETMRYQEEGNAERGRWINRVIEWGVVDGLRVPIRAQTQWNDDIPWANWRVEQVMLDVDVSARMNQFGGDVP